MLITITIKNNNRVNNNKESIIESRIIISIKSWFQLHKFMTSQIINYKNQSYFVCITCIIECHIFAPRKENRISYISIPKTSIYLFKRFYFFRFISTQF